MFGLGAGEIVIIVILGVLIFGVDKLPEGARKLGEAKAEFTRAMNAVKHELDSTKRELEALEPPNDRV